MNSFDIFFSFWCVIVSMLHFSAPIKKKLYYHLIIHSHLFCRVALPVVLEFNTRCTRINIFSIQIEKTKRKMDSSLQTVSCPVLSSNSVVEQQVWWRALQFSGRVAIISPPFRITITYTREITRQSTILLLICSL